MLLLNTSKQCLTLHSHATKSTYTRSPTLPFTNFSLSNTPSSAPNNSPLYNKILFLRLSFLALVSVPNASGNRSLNAIGTVTSSGRNFNRRISASENVASMCSRVNPPGGIVAWLMILLGVGGGEFVGDVLVVGAEFGGRRGWRSIIALL